MRINTEDCDTSLPTAEDVVIGLADIPAAQKNKYLPNDTDVLSVHWINLIKMTAALGNILGTHYRPNRPKSAIKDIEKCY